jgi:hypothetical protein
MTQEQIIEKLKSLGFELEDPFEYFADAYEMEVDGYIYNTNFVNDWETEGCRIYIDIDALRYVLLEDFETLKSLIKITD